MSDEIIQQLSEREQEILILVASGASNKAIAQELFISTNTVKVHMHNIFTKIGANSRTEAAMMAIRAGLYHPNLVSNQVPASVLADSGAPEAVFVKKWWPTSWVRTVVIILTSLVLILLIVFTLRQITARDESTTQVNTVINPSFAWEIVSTLDQESRSPAVAVSGGVIYIIGGERENGVSNQMKRFILAGRIWETLPEKPIPTADFQAIILDEKLFAPGGRVESGKVLNTMEVFSLQKGVWEQGSNLPNPVSRFALEVLNDEMYLFGGWNGSHYLDQILRYNLQTSRWEILGSMPAAAADMTVFVSGDSFHLLGGENENGQLYSTWIYKPSEKDGQWTPGEALPVISENLCAANILDFTYLFTFDQGKPQTEQAWQHTGETNSWYRFPLPIQSIQDCKAFAIGTRIYIFSNPESADNQTILQSIQAIYTTHIPNVRQPEP